MFQNRTRRANIRQMKYDHHLSNIRCANYQSQATKRNFGTTAVGVVMSSSVGVASIATFAFYRFKVAPSDKYLVMTGLGIKDIKITKKGFQWPFQTYKYLNMRPNNYTFHLNAMSNEKMEFILPGVFTIGPKDEIASLENYSRYLLEDRDPNDPHSLDELVRGIIEGETRSLSAQMTIEDIFKDRVVFKETIIDNVQKELDQFGLKIFNANIKELEDAKGSEYFQFMRQKTRSEAEGKAIIDTSEARKKADIGKKEREIISRMEIAKFEAQAVEVENLSKQNIANSCADLNIVAADAEKRTNIAKIEAEKAALKREAELQKEVEEKNILQEIERLRALNMSKAHVDAEILIRNAEGVRESKIKESEGDKESMINIANARLYEGQKEAEVILAKYQAQADGLNNLVSSFNGDADMLVKYLMLDKGVLSQLIDGAAKAIKDSNPKITVTNWNTSSDGKNDDPTATIRNLGQMMPPLLDTIYKQTGMRPADWLVKMDNTHDFKQSS